MSTIDNKSYLKFPGRSSYEGNVSKTLKFLLTDRGRGIVRYTVGTVTLGLSAALFLKETYFIENYLDIIRAYRHGLPHKVPNEFKAKIDACLRKAEFDAQESNFVKSFMFAGFDIRSVGSTSSGFGGYIGIPLNYLYETTNDVDKSNIKMGTESINWNSKYGELLEKSLVLSEDEKEFGLLKAAFELRNKNYIHRSLIPFGSICAFYFLSQRVNQHMGLYQKPRPLRLFAYTVFGTIIYGVYSVVTDSIRIRQDTKVDKSLAELGPEMCETGVRFYEKLMNRNVAFRELSGDHSTYTVKGNENTGWFRWSKLALSTRKLYMKKMLDEAHKKEGAAENAEKTAEQRNEIDDKVKT